MMCCKIKNILLNKIYKKKKKDFKLKLDLFILKFNVVWILKVCKLLS